LRYTREGGCLVPMELLFRSQIRRERQTVGGKGEKGDGGESRVTYIKTKAREGKTGPTIQHKGKTGGNCSLFVREEAVNLRSGHQKVKRPRRRGGGN